MGWCDELVCRLEGAFEEAFEGVELAADFSLDFDSIVLGGESELPAVCAELLPGDGVLATRSFLTEPLWPLASLR